MKEDKKIKLLFAIDRMNIGGAPSVVFHQMKYIDKNKFDVWLLALYPSKKANFFSQMDFLDSVHIMQFHLKKRSIFDVATWVRIYRFLKRERFDVVCTHLFLTNLIVRTLAILSRIPVIMAYEHSTYFDKKRWQIWADKALARYTDAIIVSTEAIAEFTTRQENLPLSKFITIGNPIVIPPREEEKIVALKKELNIPKDSFIVVTIGRFSEEKGHAVLLAAARIAQKGIPNVLFLIVGHGALENTLMRIMHEQGMERYCKIVSYPERAKEFLHIADLFVLSSLREGQSMVIYEAMRAGVPVIASHLEGMNNIVADGKNGALVPPGNADALAEKIVFLHKRKDLRQRFILEGKKAVEHLSPEKSVQEFAQLVYSLCGKKE